MVVVTGAAMVVSKVMVGALLAEDVAVAKHIPYKLHAPTPAVLWTGLRSVNKQRAACIALLVSKAEHTSKTCRTRSQPLKLRIVR